MMGFNLRGTNGSGKTYVAREVMKWCDATPDLMLTPRKPLMYKGNRKGTIIYILGSYETDCGGCDTISSVSVVADLLDKLWAQKGGLVFYEGLMISHMIGTVGATVRHWGMKHRMGFLDTPVDVCIARVRQRRLDAGNSNPFDPNRTLIKDYRAVQLARRNAIRQGFTVVSVPHEGAVKFVLGYMDGMLDAG